MRAFRTGATRRPFYVWAVGLTASAIALFVHARQADLELRAVLYSLVGACLTLGPLALGAHLWRRRKLWVVVDRSRGLEVSGRAVVPWREIEGIEHRGPLIEAGKEFDWESDGVGVMLAEAILLSLWFGLVEVPEWFVIPSLMVSFPIAWLAFNFFAPLVSVLSPWHRRITIRIRRTRPLVLRDLEDDEEFLRLLPTRVRSLIREG